MRGRECAEASWPTEHVSDFHGAARAYRFVDGGHDAHVAQTFFAGHDARPPLHDATGEVIELRCKHVACRKREPLAVAARALDAVVKVSRVQFEPAALGIHPKILDAGDFE